MLTTSLKEKNEYKEERDRLKAKIAEYEGVLHRKYVFSKS